jgi:hypothetical protein
LINNEYVKVEITNINLRFMRRKYKDCNIGDILNIPYKELGKCSQKKIELKCDYCGKIFNREIAVYMRKFEGIIEGQKDACEDCVNLKKNETNLNKYGTEWFTQSEDGRKVLSKNNPMYDEFNVLKNKEVVREKYGVDNIFQLEEIKEKSRQTCLEIFGFKNAMQNKEIKNKSNINRIKSLYLNGNTICSTQQKLIHELIGGELNYPVDNCSLDIAFPEEKIYVEYNGGGHDLEVKLGKLTSEQFKRKENKRYFFLKSLGWKQVCIESPNDDLPTNEIILEKIKNSIDYLKYNDKHHCIINF